jgi:hypothetical protein
LSFIHANPRQFCSLSMAKDFGMGQLNAFSTFHVFSKTIKTWVWVFNFYFKLVITFVHFSITKEMNWIEVYTWSWKLFAQSYLEPKWCHKVGGHGNTNCLAFYYYTRNQWIAYNLRFLRWTTFENGDDTPWTRPPLVAILFMFNLTSTQHIHKCIWANLHALQPLYIIIKINYVSLFKNIFNMQHQMSLYIKLT